MTDREKLQLFGALAPLRLFYGLGRLFMRDSRCEKNGCKGYPSVREIATNVFLVCDLHYQTLDRVLDEHVWKYVEALWQAHAEMHAGRTDNVASWVRSAVRPAAMKILVEAEAWLSQKEPEPAPETPTEEVQK